MLVVTTRTALLSMKKNGDSISTLRDFCQLFGGFLTLYHQFHWEYWDLSGLHIAISCKDTRSVFNKIFKVLSLYSGTSIATAAQIT